MQIRQGKPKLRGGDKQTDKDFYYIDMRKSIKIDKIESIYEIDKTHENLKKTVKKSTVWTKINNYR